MFHTTRAPVLCYAYLPLELHLSFHRFQFPISIYNFAPSVESSHLFTKTKYCAPFRTSSVQAIHSRFESHLTCFWWPFFIHHFSCQNRFITHTVRVLKVCVIDNNLLSFLLRFSLCSLHSETSTRLFSLPLCHSSQHVFSCAFCSCPRNIISAFAILVHSHVPRHYACLLGSPYTTTLKFLPTNASF